MVAITHVLYHANCADGFGAAYAAWTVLGDRAAYLPVRHGQPPPDLPADARVAILDFCYPRQVLLDLHARVAALMVLDHHRSAQADMEGLEFARFELEKSGARLAWEFWHPGAELPTLLAYVEDRDLWRWELPHSREVSTALHCYPTEFEVWESLVVDDLIDEGRGILRYQEQQVERALRRARMRKVGDHWIPTVNSCLLQSEIGDELCKAFPRAAFAGVYYTNDRAEECWSLRSIGDFDVSEVARLYGGGGHRNAAGFAVPGGLPREEGEAAASAFFQG